MKTPQEILDYTYEHMWQQNAKCYEKGHPYMCKYRLEEKSCAVGCHIPDHIYTEDIEGVGMDVVKQRLCDIYDIPYNRILEILTKKKKAKVDKFIGILRHPEVGLLPETPDREQDLVRAEMLADMQENMHDDLLAEDSFREALHYGTDTVATAYKLTCPQER